MCVLDLINIDKFLYKMIKSGFHFHLKGRYKVYPFPHIDVTIFYSILALLHVKEYYNSFSLKFAFSCLL